MNKRRDLPIALDALRGFEAAARRLSFTAAAAELFVTQSAVSRQVQQLEEQLGVKLFERRTRALVLTEAGALYAHEVGRALDLLREATAAVRAASAPVVRVTTTVTFASLWLVPRLAQFQAAHPGIAVHLAADNSIQSLERQGLDVAIRYSPRTLAGEGAVRLFGERAAPVCSPALLKGRRIRTPEDLLQLPLLEVADPQGLVPWLSWKVWCETMKLGLPRGAGGLVYSHYDQMLQAAIAGHGVALGRFPLVDRLLAARQLVLPLRGRAQATLSDRAYWLILAAGAARRAEVAAFAQWVRQQAESDAAAAGL
jgi:LysR family glycine cleavage system transcriptional activator